MTHSRLPLLAGNAHTKKKHTKDQIKDRNEDSVDGEAEISQPRKDKKRKHDNESENPATIDGVDAITHNHADSMAVALGSPAKTTKSKKDKKQNKKRHVEKHIPETIGPTTVSTMVASTSKDELSSPVSIPSSFEIETYLSTNSISISAPSTTDIITPILSFSQLTPKIPAGLCAALKGFKEPTPIQAISWPAALAGRDVVGIAETGRFAAVLLPLATTLTLFQYSGKTLAFGLPALARLVSSSSSSDDTGIPKNAKKQSRNASAGAVTTLVLAPTRELALQTHETFCVLGAPFGMSSLAVYGGVDKGPQRLALQKGQDEKGLKTRMVVGTPGRILDLINEGALDLSRFVVSTVIHTFQ